MLGFYNYTVILTYVGMLISFAGLGFAAGGNRAAALLCLMLSGFCDMFDGKIASTMERTADEKHFGIQIDSLSDLICFGVLPGFILRMQRPDSEALTVFAGLFALCALIRLAYFNVDELNRQGQTADRRREYRGLPVTSTALVLPLVYALGRYFGAQLPVVTVTMALMAVAFLTPFRLKKPETPGMLAMIAVGIVGLVLVLRGLV